MTDASNANDLHGAYLVVFSRRKILTILRNAI